MGDALENPRVRRFITIADVAAWAAAVTAAALLLASLSYHTRDPDSRVYSEISARLVEQPLRTWIAPEWPPGWYMRGPFREHPVGLFVPAAALGSLGYPAPQSAYAVNAVYQALTLMLFPCLAAAFTTPLQSRALGWILQLLPVAFVYRVRANHEPALLLFFLLALLATERSRRSAPWSALTALALVAMLLVKGVLALFGLFACGVWLLVRGAREDGRPRWAPWLGLAAATVGLGLAVAAYEAAYREVTGQSFLAYYAGRWLGGAEAAHSGPWAGEVLYSFAWYLGRLLWFAAPWSVFAAAGLGVFLAARIRGVSTVGWRLSPPEQGALFVLLVSGLYVLAFSVGDHRAERYIFPAYFAVGAWGAVTAMERWPRFCELVEAADRVPLLPVWVWCVLFAVHLLAGRLGLPRIHLWGPW